MRRSFAVTAGFVLAVTTALGAAAHPDEINDGALHDNRHALHDASHESETEGHIPQDVNYGLDHVGQDTLGGVEEGRYSDVWSDGRGFAYVGTFQEPTCNRAGVFISDISDPTNPETVTMIKSAPGTRVNDVKTITMSDGRVVLIHTEEPCGPVTPGGVQQGFGGISLWDVTDPSQPHALKQHFLDFPVHNTYPWTDDTGRTYLIGVNDIELRDVFFVDITKPQSPKLLAEVGLPDWPGAQDDQSAGMGSFSASFNHDVWVADVGDGDFQAVVSYWDAGFVTLDVNDPANPTFINDSTYPDPDPITGFSPPEGNGHAAVFDAAGATQVFAGDEDFAAFRSTFSITDGPNAGEYPAAEGAFTKPIVELDDQTMNGTTTYVGLACGESVPAAVEDGDPLTDELAVIQRGVCTFQLKAETVAAAGYDGFIVFNDEARGDALVTMAGDEIDIPGVFVGHSTGLAIFDVENVSELSVGDTGATVAVTAEFDGWGYFHLLDRATLSETGYYAPGQVNDPDYASGFGDLTMHNVEGDPTKANRAFISWYSLGMRAVEVNTGNEVRPPGDDWDAAKPGVDDYYGTNVTEVGRWIAPEGSNFWGVHVTEVDGQQYILGSDRNTGLHIFQFTP